MIALILGAGRVPFHLSNALKSKGVPFRILHLEHHAPAPDVAPGVVRSAFRIEELGTLLQSLTKDGVTEVAFAGSIARPRIDPSKIDTATLPLVPEMMAALESGDDAALRAVIGFFEDVGIKVRAPEVLLPDLIPEASVLTRVEPGTAEQRDVERAQAVVTALGSVDVGQGAVVARGLVLSVEALPGTDAMLDALATSRRTHELPRGGVLWKAPKPGQDLRIDRPTIGPDTVKAAARAGLAGIAVPEGGVLFPDREEAINLANEAGLFLWVKEAT